MKPVEIGVIIEPGDPVRRAVYGKGQRDVHPLPALVFEDGTVCTEWSFSEAERAQIARGENVRVWVRTFHQPLQPLMVEITSEVAERG